MPFGVRRTGPRGWTRGPVTTPPYSPRRERLFGLSGYDLGGLGLSSSVSGMPPSVVLGWCPPHPLLASYFKVEQACGPCHSLIGHSCQARGLSWVPVGPAHPLVLKPSGSMITVSHPDDSVPLTHPPPTGTTLWSVEPCSETSCVPAAGALSRGLESMRRGWWGRADRAPAAGAGPLLPLPLLLD